MDNYTSKVITALQESKNTIIMVYSYKLFIQNVTMLEQVAMRYNKTILFASMKDVLFNNNDNVLVIE